MLPGYNHNVQYKGRLFHIQTEDSGVQNPHIITLLYEGGNIIARKKTGYEDILKSEKLPQAVKEMMQEQHKSMLKDLKNATFDQRIFATAPKAEVEPAPTEPTPPPTVAPTPVAPPPPQAPSVSRPTAAPPPRPPLSERLTGAPIPPRVATPPPQARVAPPAPQAPPPAAPAKETKLIELKEGEELRDEDIFGADLISDKSLDEVILSYLSQNLEEE